MLQKVEVYSSSKLTSSLTVDGSAPVETDFIQILNIDGLDPVKATIDVVNSGNVDGAVSLDPQVPTRNIVLTLRPNPDWNSWTPEALRQFLYSYFIPKTDVKLVFTSDEIGVPVEIIGTVEGCDANPFTKDPTYLVSIVCPDPYFVTSDPVVVDGAIIASEDWATSKTTISLAGNIPIGIELKLTDGFSNELIVQVGDPSAVGTFTMLGSVEGILYLGSVPLNKYLRSGNPDNGTFVNRLYELQLGSKWPILRPGNNDFALMSGFSAGNAWELIYYPKYGGL